MTSQVAVTQDEGCALPGHLTLEQAIAYIGCSKTWFFANARKHLPIVRLHRVFYLRSDLDAFIAAQRKEPTVVPIKTGRSRRARRHADASWQDLAKKHRL